jgi:hypothetical protein
MKTAEMNTPEMKEEALATRTFSSCRTSGRPMAWHRISAMVVVDGVPQIVALSNAI